MKNICEWLLLRTLVSSTIILQIHAELFLHVQLLLLGAQNLLILKVKLCRLRLMQTYDRQIGRNVRLRFYIDVKTKTFSCFN